MGARARRVCGIVAVPPTITRRDLQAHTKIFEFGMVWDRYGDWETRSWLDVPPSRPLWIKEAIT